MKHLILSALVASTCMFNPADGTGSILATDIQTSFNWTYEQLEARTAGVTFAVETVNSYAATCTNKRTSEVLYPVTVSGVRVNSMIVEYPEGQTFVFTGYGDSFESGNAPVIGGSCRLSSGIIGVWTARELSNSVSGLFAHYGMEKVLVY